MDCSKCKKENRLGSKFCRFCGARFERVAGKTKDTSGKDSFLDRFVQRVKKVSMRSVAVAVVVFVLSVSLAYGAPRAKDFFAVRNTVKVGAHKLATGDYEGALSSLREVEHRWALTSQKRELENMKLMGERYLSYQETVKDSEDKEGLGLFNEARDALRSIDPDYPKYEEVRMKLSELQSKIEGALRSEVDAAATARVEAEKKAQVAATARLRAEAEAQAAAKAKARADADAATAAQAARDAEAQRQQEAAQRAEEVRKSFKSQLITGYNSYIQGTTYYTSAIRYSNESNSLLAISQANSARAVLNTALSAVSDLNARFTGLHIDYYAASDNMASAIDNLKKALDLLVQSEGTSLDYSSSINSYKDVAVMYATRVSSFLDTH